KAVVDGAAYLPVFGLPPLQHALENIGLDTERDVQIQRVLIFEIERRAWYLEEGKARAVVHLEEGMECAALVDLERADEAKSEEILVEDPRLLGIPATISVMMQTFDHLVPPRGLRRINTKMCRDQLL